VIEKKDCLRGQWLLIGRITRAVDPVNDKENKLMRSDLIFGALAHVRNRYELCQLAAKATRKLHKPTTRLQDTANEVLVRFHENNPMNADSQTASLELQEAPIQHRRAA
jgi:hypothetical protein